MSYSSVLGHRTMIFDNHRNALYADAFAYMVKAESVVIDLGAGSGVHGLMVAKAGAKKVYLVEPATALDTAKRVAEQNGLAQKIHCIENTIEQADINEKVDIIISVFTGNFLLEEDLLPSLFFARDKFLKKNGTMIPSRARMEVVPVSAADYFEKHVACWSELSQGIDFSLVRKLAANNLYYADYSDLVDGMLTNPIEIMDMDFMRATSARCHSKVTVTITKDGTCHGFLGWFKMQIGDAWLSTSPAEQSTHWSQAFLPLDPPIRVEQGDEIEFELQRPEFGEWTWTVTSGDIVQRHSTFLSEPLSTSALQKKSDNYQATLSKKGELALHVMQRLNGGESTLSVAEDIALSSPQLFPDPEHAKRFVISLIERYC